jgi:hypothetical protein
MRKMRAHRNTLFGLDWARKTALLNKQALFYSLISDSTKEGQRGKLLSLFPSTRR